MRRWRYWTQVSLGQGGGPLGSAMLGLLGVMYGDVGGEEGGDVAEVFDFN